MKWISVEEELPSTCPAFDGADYNTSPLVLVHDDKHGIVVAFLEEDEDTFD